MGILLQLAPGWQLSRGARVRFVVIPDHSSYGLIQHYLAGGAFVVTPRGLSQNGHPRPPFCSSKK